MILIARLNKNRIEYIELRSRNSLHCSLCSLYFLCSALMKPSDSRSILKCQRINAFCLSVLIAFFSNSTHLFSNKNSFFETYQSFFDGANCVLIYAPSHMKFCNAVDKKLQHRFDRIAGNYITKACITAEKSS